MMRFKGKVAHKFAESPLLQLRLPPWRSRLMALLILGSFGVLIGRAFYLQVLNNDFLQEKGRVTLPARHRDQRLARADSRSTRRCAGHFDADEVDLGDSTSRHG
jgi:hypothetical protein